LAQNTPSAAAASALTISLFITYLQQDVKVDQATPCVRTEAQEAKHGAQRDPGTERSGHGASVRGARGGSLVRFQTVTVELPVGLWEACALPPSAPAPEPCCSSESRPDKGSCRLLPVACCTGSPLFWSASASPAPPLHTETKAWVTTTKRRRAGRPSQVCGESVYCSMRSMRRNGARLVEV